jgi:hypothetical protein
MKGYVSEIFGIVLTLSVTILVIYVTIVDYVSVKSFFKESSNWFLAKDIAYMVVRCSSSEYGIISKEKISDVTTCIGFAETKYEFYIKDLDTREQWKGSNGYISTEDYALSTKEHSLFVPIKNQDGSIDRGVVYVTMYAK